ncbi:hypothetical protein [Clostridium sp.]|uniref:hypothetical protein n=1 Tax=Clostridium sp. TaxID=1506 RepID=UPI00260FB69E|nr:hypothetical protein [Clostridium sp.]
MSIRYQYQLVLSLANRKIGIEKIGEEIERSFREFNVRSITAKNPKKLVKYEIRKDENLLYIWLDSNNKMDFPLRGLFLFSKLIMEQLYNSKDEEKKKLPNEIIRNKCFFKLVEEPKEVKKLKLEKSQDVEIKANDCLKNDVEEIKGVQETNNNLSEVSYLLQEITALFLKSNPSEQEKEKIKIIKRVLKGEE